MDAPNPYTNYDFVSLHLHHPVRFQQTMNSLLATAESPDLALQALSPSPSLVSPASHNAMLPQMAAIDSPDAILKETVAYFEAHPEPVMDDWNFGAQMDDAVAEGDWLRGEHDGYQG